MAKIKLKNVQAPIIKAGLNALGVVAGAKLDGFLPVASTAANAKNSILTDPRVKAGIKIAAGIGLTLFLNKGKTGGMAADFGAGLASIGFLQLANATVLKTNKVSISGNEWPTLGYVPGYSFTQPGNETNGEVSGNSNAYAIPV